MFKSAKAQVSTEFIIMVGLGFTMLLIFSAANITRLSKLSDSRELNLLRDIALKVQNEINLAAGYQDGYRRTFEIPEKLENIYNYTLRIENRTLIANSKNHEFVALVPELNGSLQKGDNTIKKNGKVQLN